MSPFKRYRDAAIIVLLLAVPFFFLRANMKRPENLNALDRTILRVSAPIEFGASSASPAGSRTFGGIYVYLVDAKADNARLAYDNARLRENVHRLEQQEVENRELKRLLQLRETVPGDAISAQVVGRGLHRVLSVCYARRARSRFARRKAPHARHRASDGVVGTVIHVAGDAIDVQLSVDAQFAIDVEDERTHARGFARGTGDPARYSCKMEMVSAEDEVDVGDRLRHERQRKVVPERASGRARHGRRQARARARSGDRRGAHGQLLPSRLGPHPGLAAPRRPIRYDVDRDRPGDHDRVA